MSWIRGIKLELHAKKKTPSKSSQIYLYRTELPLGLAYVTLNFEAGTVAYHEVAAQLKSTCHSVLGCQKYMSPGSRYLSYLLFTNYHPVATSY